MVYHLRKGENKVILSEFISKFCLHDSTLESVKYYPEDHIIIININDYYYDCNLDIGDDCRSLKCVFNSCSNLENLPQSEDGKEIDEIFDCYCTGSRMTFVLSGMLKEDASEFSFDSK